MSKGKWVSDEEANTIINRSIFLLFRVEWKKNNILIQDPNFKQDGPLARQFYKLSQYFGDEDIPKLMHKIAPLFTYHA